MVVYAKNRQDVRKVPRFERQLDENLELFFFFQAEDGIRDLTVTGVQTCALPISPGTRRSHASRPESTAASTTTTLTTWRTPGCGAGRPTTAPHSARPIGTTAPSTVATSPSTLFVVCSTRATSPRGAAGRRRMGASDAVPEVGRMTMSWGVRLMMVVMTMFSVRAVPRRRVIW